MTSMWVAAIPYVLLVMSVSVAGVAFWSHTWPSVKGVIEVSIYDEEWQTSSTNEGASVEKVGEFYLLYSFTLNGEERQSNRIKPIAKLNLHITGHPKLGTVRADAHRFREGAVVDVFYCPYFPSWVCLEPGGFTAAVLLGLAGGVAFWVV